MVTVNTHEAKTRLSELLKKVEDHHERIIICRNGHPVAEVLPWLHGSSSAEKNPRLSDVVIAKDAFAPLSEEDWPLNAR